MSKKNGPTTFLTNLVGHEQKKVENPWFRHNESHCGIFTTDWCQAPFSKKWLWWSYAVLVKSMTRFIQNDDSSHISSAKSQQILGVVFVSYSRADSNLNRCLLCLLMMFEWLWGSSASWLTVQSTLFSDILSGFLMESGLLFSITWSSVACLFPFFEL